MLKNEKKGMASGIQDKGVSQRSFLRIKETLGERTKKVVRIFR